MADRLTQAWMKWYTRPPSRRLRRCLICVLLATLLLQVLNAVWSVWWENRQGTGRFYGLAAAVYSVTALGYTWFWSWFLTRMFSTPSLEERAQADFGKPYTQLSPRHRFDVRVRVRQQVLHGGQPVDEREAALQHTAEHQAVRVLRLLLPAAVLLFWLVCIGLPAGDMRAGLIMGAVVLTVTVAPVLLLPPIIRAWTGPDALPEVSVVSPGTEA